jgi:prepilin-type N-terminal cleavage/methylation domain-containing protein/prepilin-type processing-associated H-X9-DG protein
MTRWRPGRGFAMTRNGSRSGVSLVEVLIVLAVVGILFALGLAAVQQTREKAARASCASNLRQLGLALHQYHDAFHVFPQGITNIGLPIEPAPSSPDEYHLMRWHGRILPFVEQQSLWDLTVEAYQQDWTFLNDPPHTARTVWVPVFLCPADTRRAFPGWPSSADIPASTSYVGVAGVSHFREDGILFLDSRVRLADVTDGASNTLLAGERPPEVNYFLGLWYANSGYWITAQSTLGVRETGVRDWIPGCPDGPYLFGPGTLRDPCSAFHYWSLHANGANFLFADGAVRFLPYPAAPFLPALATRSGGEIASFPD